jgi:hypothetical protein
MIPENDKISVNYQSSLIDMLEINHYLNMFMEDFWRDIVPNYGSKSEKITCELKPDHTDFKLSLIELLSSFSQHYHPSFKDIILDTIEYIAQQLVNNGYLVLELVKYKDVDERVFYKFETVYGKDIILKNEMITQILPDEVAQDLGKFKIEIPVEKCFVFEFPLTLGGKEKYLHFLKDFEEFANQSPAINYINNSLQGQKNYNLMEHQSLFEIELWKKSKLYNYHHRKIGEEKLSGYYNFYKQLLFRKNQILLRDYIVDELCKIISKLSEKLYGEKVELEIEGLIKIEKVDEKLEQWKTGTLIPFTLTDIF